MKLLLALFVTLVSWAASAEANDCANAQTQTQMNVCASESAKKADAALNAAYAQIKTRLKDDTSKIELITKAQRAWIAFRDAECGFAGSAVEGGSMQPMIVAACREEVTAKRTSELDAYLKCEEGDTSCPVPAR
jgi:uncharacterized protein YecT (DUF1311 family)